MKLSSSASSSSSARRPHVSSDRLLRLLAIALVLLVSSSLLLSTLCLRCQSSVLSSASAKIPPPPLSSTASSSPSGRCSPKTIDPRDVLYSSPHKFTDLLRAHAPLFPPPAFVRKHRHLCDPDARDREWSFCLPITARHDLPYCDAPDRMDLLSPQSPRTLCYASVLHLLLVDVYDELTRHGGRPALLFGSLLGAVRNQSLIPYTEDADLGFVNTPDLRMRRVKQALYAKGYHVFRQGVLRVCVAPNHPLASNLYDPRRDALHRARHVPYVDLYRMQLAPNRREWEVEETRKDRHVPASKFEPYATVTINGRAFDTLADSIDFLEHEYGTTWRTPLRRGTYRVVDGNDTVNDLPQAARPPRAIDDMADGDFDSAVEYDNAMPELDDVDAGELDGHDGDVLDEQEEQDDDDEGDGPHPNDVE